MPGPLKDGVYEHLVDEALAALAEEARREREVDIAFRRRRTPVQIVATGSSARHLAAGARESIAGRFERLTLTHWPASSIARELGVAPEGAAALVAARRGARRRSARASRR